MAVTEITGTKHGCHQTVDCFVCGISYTGKRYWQSQPVDKCLAPFVRMLNDSGLLTKACCCGHGRAPGGILLHNGDMITFPTCKNYKTCATEPCAADTMRGSSTGRATVFEAVRSWFKSRSLSFKSQSPLQLVRRAVRQGIYSKPQRLK